MKPSESAVKKDEDKFNCRVTIVFYMFVPGCIARWTMMVRHTCAVRMYTGEAYQQSSIMVLMQHLHVSDKNNGYQTLAR